jgi:hypothetical protein
MRKNNKHEQPLQKDLDNEMNFDELPANLNFAFCPTFLLKANNKTKEESGIFNSVESKSKIVDSLMDIARYFYICYSFRFDESKQDYFFFQSFSAVGSQISSSEPVFGFFTKEEILTLISKIDETFLPRKHEKQIYDSYINEYSSSADYLLTIMAEWTKIKLQHFEYLYSTSEEVQQEMEKLINQFNKTEAKSLAKRKKTQKAEAKTDKTDKNGKSTKPTKPTKPRGTRKPKPASAGDSSKPASRANKKTDTSKDRRVNSKSNKK